MGGRGFAAPTCAFFINHHRAKLPKNRFDQNLAGGGTLMVISAISKFRMPVEGVPNQKKYTAEVPTIEATTFEVIEVNGEPMRVVGHTGPEGSKGRMKILADITAEDIKENLEEQRAEQMAYDHVMRMKENNPLVDVDREMAIWTRAFKSGRKMEASINEAYAKKGEHFLKEARARMLEFETSLNTAQSDAEKEVIFQEIEKLRNDMIYSQEQVDFRRSLNR